MKNIVIIGECMLELTGEPFGLMQQFYGGDTLNTATYLARTSLRDKLRIFYFSALGQDPLSKKMKACWQEEGINTELVFEDPVHQPGLYLIQVDDRGERTFLYWRNQSAARYLLQHPRFAEAVDTLARADMIYLSGISLAILSPEDRGTLLQILTSLAKQGVKIAFDPNYRMQLWESEQSAQQAYQQVFSIAHIVLVTFDDEQLLWFDKSIEQSMARLASFDIPVIVIKDGKSGAFYCDHGKVIQVTTNIVQNVIDTTSAGDAFNAGFLQGYLSGKNIDICCQQGNQLAGVVIQHRGAIINKSATQHLFTTFNV